MLAVGSPFRPSSPRIQLRKASLSAAQVWFWMPKLVRRHGEFSTADSRWPYDAIGSTIEDIEDAVENDPSIGGRSTELFWAYRAWVRETPIEPLLGKGRN